MGTLHVQALEKKPLIYYGTPCSGARKEIVFYFLFFSVQNFVNENYDVNKMSQRDDSSLDSENAQQ